MIFKLLNITYLSTIMYGFELCTVELPNKERSLLAVRYIESDVIIDVLFFRFIASVEK